MTSNAIDIELLPSSSANADDPVITERKMGHRLASQYLQRLLDAPPSRGMTAQRFFAAARKVNHVRSHENETRRAATATAVATRALLCRQMAEIDRPRCRGDGAGLWRITRQGRGRHRGRCGGCDRRR